MSFIDRLSALFFGTPVKTRPPFDLLEQQQQEQTRQAIFDWPPERLRLMLNEYYDGNFGLAEEFYEQCRRDGRIYDGIRKRGNAVTRYPQKWRRKKTMPPEVRAAMKKLRRVFGTDCMTKADLAETARRLCMFGLCILYRHYRPKSGIMAPVFTPWTMRGVTADPNRRVFRVPQANGVTRDVPYTGDRDFVVISAGGERPWIDGAIPPLAKLFLLLFQGWDKWAQHNDIQALAIKILKTPYYSREQLETGEAYNVVRMLRAGDTWLNPQAQGNTPGYELELLESKHANAYEAFKHLLELAWSVVAIILLGHNLSQEVKSGSLAATEAAMEATREVSEADASIITSCLRPVFTEWMVINFSPKARASWSEEVSELAPRWCIDAEPKEDEEKRTKVQTQRATAVKTTVDAMKAANVDMETAEIDWHATNEACGLVLLPLPPGKKRQPVKYSEPPPALPAGAAGLGKPKPKLMSGRAPRALLLSGREPETEEERSRSQPS